MTVTTDSPFDELEDLAAMITINGKHKTGVSVVYGSACKVPLKEAISLPATVKIDLTVGVGNDSKKIGKLVVSRSGTLEVQLQGLGKTSTISEVSKTKHTFVLEAS